MPLPPTPIEPSCGGWSPYVERFHAIRPAITERILTRCRSDGLDPYRWCALPLHGREGPVLDVACGSGPLAHHLTGWIGVDTSAAELDVASSHCRGPLLRSSATHLPISAGAVSAAVCSMAMQVIEPLPAAIAELSRVLRPGGRAVLLLPASGPLGGRQAAFAFRLQVALRRRIRYPNDRALSGRRLAASAGANGLVLAGDERRAFGLPLEHPTQVDNLLQALYLPGVNRQRLERAHRILTRRLGTELTVPLRRVVLDALAPSSGPETRLNVGR